jgi:hypothetical protein
MTEAALPPPSDTPPAAVAPPVAVAPPAVPPPAAAAPGPAARRPGLDPATRRQTIVVAAVIAALFWGTQVLNEAIPAKAATGGQVSPGEVVAIGGGARITPLVGWETAPHDNGIGIRLEKGLVVIDLYPETFGDTAADLAQAYLEEVLRPEATQLTETDTQVATTPTGTAARFAYQGMFKGVDVAIEGEVTAVKAGDQGVIADAWSSQGDLGNLLGEVHAMLETLEVGS